MALWQESGRCLCDLGCFGPVVLPLGRVALDFSGGRLGLLVERWAGLRLLQRRVTVPARQELSHTLFQELDVHLVTALLQREFRKCIRLHYNVISTLTTAPRSYCTLKAASYANNTLWVARQKHSFSCMWDFGLFCIHNMKKYIQNTHLSI